MSKTGSSGKLKVQDEECCVHFTGNIKRSKSKGDEKEFKYFKNLMVGEDGLLRSKSEGTMEERTKYFNENWKEKMKLCPSYLPYFKKNVLKRSRHLLFWLNDNFLEGLHRGFKISLGVSKENQMNCLQVIHGTREFFHSKVTSIKQSLLFDKPVRMSMEFRDRRELICMEIWNGNLNMREKVALGAIMKFDEYLLRNLDGVLSPQIPMLSEMKPRRTVITDSSDDQFSEIVNADSEETITTTSRNHGNSTEFNFNENHSDSGNFAFGQDNVTLTSSIGSQENQGTQQSVFEIKRCNNELVKKKIVVVRNNLEKCFNKTYSLKMMESIETMTVSYDNKTERFTVIGCKNVRRMNNLPKGCCVAWIQNAKKDGELWKRGSRRGISCMCEDAQDVEKITSCKVLIWIQYNLLECGIGLGHRTVDVVKMGERLPGNCGRKPKKFTQEHKQGAFFSKSPNISRRKNKNNETQSESTDRRTRKSIPIPDIYSRKDISELSCFVCNEGFSPDQGFDAIGYCKFCEVGVFHDSTPSDGGLEMKKECGSIIRGGKTNEQDAFMMCSNCLLKEKPMCLLCLKEITKPSDVEICMHQQQDMFTKFTHFSCFSHAKNEDKQLKFIDGMFICPCGVVVGSMKEHNIHDLRDILEDVIVEEDTANNSETNLVEDMEEGIVDISGANLFAKKRSRIEFEDVNQTQKLRKKKEKETPLDITSESKKRKIVVVDGK